MALLDDMFEHIWSQRAMDIEPGMTITVPFAVAHLRDQTRLTREVLANRLGVNNSKLAYLESSGSAGIEQFKRLKELANEYYMPNLEEFFDRQVRQYYRADETRKRRYRPKPE